MSQDVRTAVTGFSNPAEIYAKSRLDIHNLVVADDVTTFFMRLSRDYTEYQLNKGSVLVIDRAKYPKEDSLCVVSSSDGFSLSKGDTCDPLVEHWGVVTWVLQPLENSN